MLACLLFVHLVVSVPVSQFPTLEEQVTGDIKLQVQGSEVKIGIPPKFEDGVSETSQSSLGVLTYNLQFLPFQNHDQRAAAIASKVLASNYDIVSFQEVFNVVNPSSYQVLLRELSSSYPHISPSTAMVSNGKESSGVLMLSKLPLLPMAHPTQLDQRAMFPIQNNEKWLFESPLHPLYNQKYTFTEFQVSNDFDALAAKGILCGLVDVSPKFGHEAITEQTLKSHSQSRFKGRQILFVFSAHFQSGKANQNVDARRAQLAQALTLIKSTIAANVNSESSLYRDSDFGVMLLGDLNEDSYWTARDSRDSFKSVLGDPVDLLAASSFSSSVCKGDNCVDPVCDAVAPISNESAPLPFSEFPPRLNKVAQEKSLSSPQFTETSFRSTCSFTCCLDKDPSSVGFATKFLTSELLDYIFMFGSTTPIQGRLVPVAGTKAAVKSENEWLLSDHLALEAQIKLGVKRGDNQAAMIQQMNDGLPSQLIGAISGGDAKQPQ